MVKEVNTIRRKVGELLPKVVFDDPRIHFLELHRIKELALVHGRPGRRRWCPAEPADGVELINLIFGPKDGAAVIELPKDATRAPHVNLWSVDLVPKQELWRAIPAGDNNTRTI